VYVFPDKAAAIGSAAVAAANQEIKEEGIVIGDGGGLDTDGKDANPFSNSDHPKL
jgi:hypothetical protein